MVSAWASSARLVLAQAKGDDRSYEITAVPERDIGWGYGDEVSEHVGLLHNAD